jgi:hypothetical protein
MKFLSKYILILIIGFCSCNQSRSIKVEAVHQTSDLLEHVKVYANTVEAIHYRNEILLQTGIIDTTSEHRPIKAAIVFINKQEIILDSVNRIIGDNIVTEVYQNKKYKLTLIYSEKKHAYYKKFYEGEFIIESNKLNTTYKIQAGNFSL